MPCAGVLEVATRRPSPASLPSTPVARVVVLTELPASTVAVSSTAFGATRTVTVTVSDFPLPSTTVTSNPSVPE
ncbi:hypothetical protein DEJ15_05230 [Curtobacterium sp. MCJR17_043]|nr:hypothetical protein [Curtobacterium sp. MCJR17_043]WIB36529.1 hypothetical protein DEJ15_05230 [Curtobacterium sp. MCJR17_043]